jgi:hypothetical protein
VSALSDIDRMGGSSFRSYVNDQIEDDEDMADVAGRPVRSACIFRACPMASKSMD